ncbi:MAG: low molecular weight phosphotyrosine protein phosphatase, partial [Pseudomonadota bacterium]
PRTVACARRRGVDLSTLKARKVAPGDFGRFDLILAMDRGHLRQLQRFDGARGTELALFGTAAGLGEIDVPDPYYGGEADFEAAYDLIAKGVDGLIERLKA